MLSPLLILFFWSICDELLAIILDEEFLNYDEVFLLHFRNA
jgi:hypothetical protein